MQPLLTLLPSGQAASLEEPFIALPAMRTFDIDVPFVVPPLQGSPGPG